VAAAPRAVNNNGLLSNVGVLNLNLWVHTLTEVWGWARPEEAMGDRTDRPWDDAGRRPSHAERRRALQGGMLEEEDRSLGVPEPWCEKIRHLLTGVIRLVA
jgi:hypothetical protein